MCQPAPNSHNFLNISALVDEARCFQAIRDTRWPDGVVRCPHCNSAHVIKHGTDEVQVYRQKYRCNSCPYYFDDLTKTPFRGYHQSITTWVLCLYFMALNLSNQRIGQQLDLKKDVAPGMAC